MHYMNANLHAVLLIIAVLGAIVVVVQPKWQALFVWSCAIGFFALAWNAVAAAGWF